MQSLRRLAVVAGIWIVSAVTVASDPDATIVIDRSVDSPLVSVKYSGASASVAELRVNGESVATRSLNAGASSGESSFTLNFSTLLDGENEIEVRLFDKSGRLLGTQKTIVKHSSSKMPTIYLAEPKMGSSVQGAVEIKVGFGQKLKNAYVSFFVDKQFKTISNVNPFDYVWDTLRESNGWHEVEAWVVDDSSETRKSKPLRLFVDNPGGRTNRRFSATKTTATLTRVAAPAPQPAKIAPIAAPAKTVVTSKVVAAPARGVTTGAIIATRTLLSSVAAVSAARPGAPRPAGVVMEPTAATGLRFLTPTGKRNAAEPKAAAPVTAPVAVAPTTKKVATTLRKAKPVAKVASVSAQPMANKQEVKVAQASTAVRVVRGDGQYQLSAKETALVAPRAITAKTAPSAAPKPIKVDLSPTKPAAPTAAASAALIAATPKVGPTTTTLIKVEKGVRIAAKGSFAVVMDGALVEFDVQPRIDEGVPMTPLRHLIEKKGGKVEWEAVSKSVSAQAEGHDIFLQIGARVAKIDKKDIELELKPYLDKGRVIVPLSFIKESLHVNVDYDRATGHVLITRAN